MYITNQFLISLFLKKPTAKFFFSFLFFVFLLYDSVPLLLPRLPSAPISSETLSRRERCLSWKLFYFLADSYSLFNSLATLLVLLL
uniref:Uncharacterized protein n=1 Tax=Anguilla anguilla TaxID=7936 RepID=A0A0E9WCT8_ANGAN